MIEITIKKYLEEVIGIKVYLEMPNAEADKFIVFEKTGSGRENQLDSSTFAFQSYAPSLYEASVLNDRVKDALFNMVRLPEFSKITLNSDYNFTDLTTKRYRYQAVFNIYHY